ncbi:30S ribosomal protein S15 [Candidatus Uabimicrobium amorphum]|uniref:Small ribosomal subunit protein uS15 n=1 Tax=Uabimicrobium amorphum TaxID=2596890 RepID=A0A5S9F3M5_UABAM|nr:30S ribosomal protein S15 [Candidatus Uabimicrobium amorphum]BBM84846.1 30S ribosomal protein S15 [Candidatus Uabimicrobium amorphum]
MAMTPKNKNNVVEKYRKHEKDSGSPEVQIAIFTKRIEELTQHLKKHRKDYATRRGLLMLVGQRTSLLRYLKKKDVSRYQAIIKELGIRK